MGVSRPTFAMARFREAYDTEQVDLAVAMVLENLALPRPRIDRTDIEALQFTPTRGGGYDMTDVDDWLDEVVAELDARGAGASGAAPASEAPVEASVEAPLEAPGEQAHAPATSTATSTAITEVPSGGRGTLLLVLAILVVAGLVAYALFA